MHIDACHVSKYIRWVFVRLNAVFCNDNVILLSLLDLTEDMVHWIQAVMSGFHVVYSLLNVISVRVCICLCYVCKFEASRHCVLKCQQSWVSTSLKMWSLLAVDTLLMPMCTPYWCVCVVRIFSFMRTTVSYWLRMLRGDVYVSFMSSFILRMWTLIL